LVIILVLKENLMSDISEQNKKLILEAFDTLFIRRDYAAAEQFWSPEYIQHSAHIEPGREGLLNLIRSLPPTLKYEPGLVIAEGDCLRDGVLVEHWDVIQDEATEVQSKSKAPV
jgi:predicted SnoaL-like aldol condensation-catalyzing enzyme